jgi:hypothetical protein
MITMPVDDLLKDVRERLRRGTVTPQNVEDLLDAAEDLLVRVQDQEVVLEVAADLKERVEELEKELEAVKAKGGRP